jgi:hypothetical protein
MSRRVSIALLSACFVFGVDATGSTEKRWPGIQLEIPDGSRVKTPDCKTVYLVDRGFLRPLEYTAYKNLWSNWRGIGLITEAPPSLLGDAMNGATKLVRAKDDPHVWLIDNGLLKRHVRSLTVTGFSMHLVETVEPELLAALYEGPPID